MRQQPPTIADALVTRPTTFQVGAHAVVVAKLPTGTRWSVSVDSRLLDQSFESQVDAWEAGVRDADRVDRAAGAAPGGR